MPGDENKDWAVESADSIERFVSSVRAKTAEPLERVARIFVFGLLAVILGTAAVVLLAVGAVRGLDIAIPGEVWSAHLITGGIFSLLGLLCWAKRRPSTPRH